MITISIWSTFAEDYNYPIYYWTKKCETNIENVNTEENRKIFAYYHDLKDANYYIINWDLYKKRNLYKKWVDYLLFEINWNVIYWVKNYGKIDIYINDKKSISVDEIDTSTLYYDEYTDKYQFEINNNSKRYIYSNWELIDYDSFYFQTRYFSENRKVYIDLYNNDSWFRLEKDWKVILEEKWNYYIKEIAISKDNDYSLIWYDNTNKKYIFLINWIISNIENVVKIVYWPNWNDLYYVTKIDNNYKFYKNEEKLWEFKIEIYNNLDFNFIDDNNFYIILTNWTDYALIKNWKTIISFDSDIQIKLILKKENWDIFLVKRYKKLWKDIFYINWKKVLEADKIDERYLNEWKWTFSIYPNRLKSNQYYTYATINDYNYLFVNGYLIPNMYDYLKLENGLDDFSFFSMDSKLISCKDITSTYTNLWYDREYLEQLILKTKKLNYTKKDTLVNKFKKSLEKSNLSEINRELIKIFIDNLTFNLN